MNATIPEEALTLAHDIYVECRRLAKGGACEQGELIWAPIARALLARDERAAKKEREACAKVAEREAGVSPSSVIVPAVAFRIASAIRDRSKP